LGLYQGFLANEKRGVSPKNSATGNRLILGDDCFWMGKAIVSLIKGGTALNVNVQERRASTVSVSIGVAIVFPAD
jgi:hypothetical protein